ncbi:MULTISPECIES: hypothetical protein [Alphaproteobacteria]|uniref:Uncharacterized protein n=2 Tax=Alphaproteobacteria TaxID=28211 RepID=A0A512HD75_9HYPH|nr:MULTISPECIES: hypothetical protein [Alphaproteobacteria]GEO83399.1 hypothetical protein RNA01_03310 [Ciceribacter naphthalenivorans]GLR23028.1 hypothetical protein GCM10007920_28160 [Ciceribacter naphthalenivorans]GLT05884.1 hypothetical protein GCM10007926_28160 [Sphingomonas psychrolutea]
MLKNWKYKVLPVIAATVALKYVIFPGNGEFVRFDAVLRSFIAPFVIAVVIATLAGLIYGTRAKLTRKQVQRVVSSGPGQQPFSSSRSLRLPSFTQS